VYTTLYLIRNGATEWTREGRLAGRREIGLSHEGRSQADELGARMAGVELAEILSSPLPRAVETAERLAAPHKVEVARDPRLTDVNAGQWEGARFSELASNEAYKKFSTGSDEPIPGCERLSDLRGRMVASVAQALSDNELGAGIAIVSHAAPLRALLAHYLGMPLGGYHRLRLSPASVTALRFESEYGAPRLLLLNGLGDIRSALH
jgi:probable phosphoglycerate mutase